MAAACTSIFAIGLQACERSAPQTTASEAAEEYAEPRLIRDEPANPFPQADHVRLFVHSGKRDSDGRAVMLEKGGRRLTDTQRAEVGRLIRRRTYEGSLASAMCFVPHHFFRYYDSSEKEIGEVQVCFCCAGVLIDPGPASRQGEQFEFADDLEPMIGRMGLPTDIECEGA